MKEKILVIGSNGMLGQRFVEHINNLDNYNLITASYEEKSFFDFAEYFTIDISNEIDVKKLIKQTAPNYIVNTAAYTNVDKSETEKDAAKGINVFGVKFIAEAAKEIGAHFIHISSDYVFNGYNGPYSEEDTTDPVGYYGLTKLEGEIEIKNILDNYSILRTNVLYGPAKFGRPDFVKWVYTNLKDNKQIKIVTDQINNPTYIDDLVSAIFLCITKKVYGIYHIGGKEFLNRYEFTKKIANYFELDTGLIIPITTAELNQAAKRPLKSGLITKKAEANFGYIPTELTKTFELMKKELSM